MFSLSNKIALVTGATQGLGMAMAQGLGKAGAVVVYNDIIPERIEKAKAIYASQGIQAHGYACNVTDSLAIDQMISRIEAEVGPIDILVNSAGIMRKGPLESLSDEDWQAVLDVNLTSVFKVSKRVVRGMIERKKGKIININSMMSELGRPTVGAYAAAKGGLKMLTRNMAVEWAKHNIQVNGIGPGYHLSDITRPLAEDPVFTKLLMSRTPAKRWGTPEDLMGPAVFLASEASDFVNGHILYVDGGILASFGDTEDIR
ncbi:MAG: gluconate 5-dehydrogenase [Cytophagaceae bacterium]|jgi:gluconate 5-dehydrogenase|nr:gluconate 5-dehydrogenase [Cytophagaceae bacterium]